MKELKIKVCGMKFPQNISELEVLNPDFLGFIFYPFSKRFVNHETFSNNSSFQNKIGVFVNQSIEFIEEQIIKYNLKGVQLHGDEEIDFIKQLKQKILIIKAFQINESFNFSSLKAYESVVDFFLFDTKSNSNQRGGTGKKFDWKLLELYNLEKPFFLSGGITLEDIEEIKKIEHPKFYGLDINSGFEEYAGFKNIEKIKTFVNQIKE